MKTVLKIKNCAGCKWLDQVKNHAKGEGYCCAVEHSRFYKSGDKVRHSDMGRCEFYEAGEFKARFDDNDPPMANFVTEAISTGDKYWKCPRIDFNVGEG